MIEVLKAITLVVAGIALIFEFGIAILHTIVELEEYYYHD